MNVLNSRLCATDQFDPLPYRSNRVPWWGKNYCTIKSLKTSSLLGFWSQVGLPEIIIGYAHQRNVWHTFLLFNFSYTTYHLTHWGRVTHIGVSKLTIIGSDNGLSPGRRQAIIWTNAGILSVGPLGTNFSEILIEIRILSFKKMHLKMPSAKWRPFDLGLNVLKVSAMSFWKYLPQGLMRSWWQYAVSWHCRQIIQKIIYSGRTIIHNSYVNTCHTYYDNAVYIDGVCTSVTKNNNTRL